jgi:hypothetical protein
MTPLMTALERKDEQMVEMLLSKEDIYWDQEDYNGYTIAHHSRKCTTSMKTMLKEAKKEARSKEKEGETWLPRSWD